MRTATATALITATLAHAAVPDKLFNFKALQVGKAANCAGAEGITLKATPEKIVWGFSDFGASIPAENPDDDLGVVFCVMENFLSHLPVGWKFSVVSATTSGTAQFTDGAWLQSMGTSTGIDVGYPEDFGVPFAERVYKFRTASIGSFQLTNTTLNDGKDLDGKFEVTVPAAEEQWSPCWHKNFTVQQTEIGFGHQSYFFIEKSPKATDNAVGKLDPDVQVSLELKWQECDPEEETIEDFGKEVEVPEGWTPVFF